MQSVMFEAANLRKENEMELSDSMITRAVDAISFDPLKSARADYAQLKAHYQMVFEAGNKLLQEARLKNNEAVSYLNEAQEISQQMAVLERLHPEACT